MPADARAAARRRPPASARGPPRRAAHLAAPRAAQVGQRTLAVGLARELLMHLPEPFKQSTFEAAAAAAGEGEGEGEDGGGSVAAPWSVVCLAAMLHRRGAARARPPLPPLPRAPRAPPACAPTPRPPAAPPLARRCSDKAAAVRARALSDLAEAVACFGELLGRDPASDEYRVAERFVGGLAAAAQLTVRRGGGAGRHRGRLRRGGRRRAGAPGG